MNESKEEYDPLLLWKLLLGARSSVDILVQERNVDAVHSELGVLTSLLNLPRAEVKRRAIICRPNDYIGADFEKNRLQASLELFPKGWDIRLSETTASAGALIVDGRDALIVDAESIYQHTSEASRISALQDHFERVWACDKYAVLYEDILRRELSDYQGYAVLPSWKYWDELIRQLARTPQLLYELDPRRFEELVAELLHRQGCDVHLTPKSKDSGYDIIARLSVPVGIPLLYLVECKRWAKSRPVGVQIINALYGVVEKGQATGGMLVTTSSFTKGALLAQQTLSHRLVLNDYNSLVNWLHRGQL